MGYPSLFEFATRELGYSAGAAFRRIQSMRLLKDLPELEEKVGDGSLSLCVAAKTQSFLKKENKKRAAEKKPALHPHEKQELAQSMLGLSARDCERKLAEISPESALPQSKSRPVAQGKTLVQFVADDALLEKIERLKALLAHQNFEGRYDKLFEILADLALKKLEPANLKNSNQNASASKDPQAPVFPTLEKPRSRYIPAAAKRAVWLRDQGICTYQDPVTRRRCASRHGVQYDHAFPFAWGGKNTVENLRLRCAPHNGYTAKLQGLAPSQTAPSQVQVRRS
jgi:5-methylcytosine-specific restriction endonuclease McrA